MADNESVDVNIASGVNGDSSEHDNFAEKKTESYAAVVRGEDHHRHGHHGHHGHQDHHQDHHLKARIEELERENEELKAAEAEREQLEGKAMGSITKRAFDLEGEVSRLQHDLGTAMNAGDEAGREIERLVTEIDELRREKSALSEKIEELKRSESASGSRISELEKKIEKLEESEREARREKAAAEDQAKARLDELEREITLVKKEKTLVEEAMGTLEAELKNSEEKVIQMAGRIEQLAKNTEESEEIIAGMVEKASQRGIDGITEAVESDGGFLKSKISVPVAGTVSAGVVVAALAVCYVRFSRTR